MLCCVDSGFCYIPQESINNFICWLCVSVLQPSQYSYFILHVLMGPSTTWAKFIRGIWGSSFLTLLFWFPILLSYRNEAVMVPNSGLQSFSPERVGINRRQEVTSSSNCDLFLRGKAAKQEMSSVTFSSFRTSTSSGIWPASVHTLASSGKWFCSRVYASLFALYFMQNLSLLPKWRSIP